MIDAILSEVAQLKCCPGEIWFRGHSDADWPLVPRLLRSAHGENQESNLLMRFRVKAMSIEPNPPDDKDAARWLFLMQHHGLPTRLLDWTESALAALFFAVQEHDKRDGCVHILSPIGLNNSQTGEPVIYAPTSPCVNELLASSFLSKNKKKSSDSLALMAYASNDRIARQFGNFTIHGDTQNLLVKIKPEWFRTIRIPARSKTTVRTQLEYCGVNRTSLFNNLESLARDLSEQHGVG